MKSLHDRSPEQIRAALQRVRAFLLDMDGTFYLGDRVLEGSMEFLDAVERTGRKYLFLTNNSSRSVKHYVEKLHRLGLDVGEEKILTSGQAAAQYLLREHPGKRVYLLGNPSLAQEMRAYGIVLEEEDPDLVLVGFDTTLDYAKMCRVCDLVRAGLPYVATHPDFNCPTETGFAPDIGAIMAFIEASTGRRADLVVGKPNTGIVRAALSRTGLTAGEMAMVGDRLYTDVETGLKSGMLSVLVMSGETTPEMLEAYPNKPDVVFGCLADMIPLL